MFRVVVCICVRGEARGMNNSRGGKEVGVTVLQPDRWRSLGQDSYLVPGDP